MPGDTIHTRVNLALITRINPAILLTFKNTAITTDSVFNITDYLAPKASCDYDKAIDSNGCIITQYTDGFTKKICNGIVTEVITADGHRYVLKRLPPNIKIYITPLPPPPNPGVADPSYTWLNNYSNELLKDVKTLLKNSDALVKTYLDGEYEACNNNVYKQIEYRTVFLQTVYQAH
jgi:hypothetical protein